MRHSWFGEDRIVMLLAERERGERTAESADAMGAARARSPNGRPGLAAWEVLGAGILKALETGNERLKALLADAMLATRCRRIC